jgi:integrin-linked kinase-associated serine/threonine phosphatase 2C
VIGSKKTDPNVSIIAQKTAYQMSVDHKANREDEKKRIESKNGVVSCDKSGSLGPPRVYPRNDDGPGLAVSRSLGDLILHNHGVTSEPEITHKEIDHEDKFVVIGSDGVWDVMNSSEVIGFIFDKNEVQAKERICEELVNEARYRWEVINQFKIRLQNEKSKEMLNSPSLTSKGKHVFSIDDITAIICFLNVANE